MSSLLQPIPRSLRDEIARRRTFAIVSHPDAGKTTLTEKLLLYGGALHLAGSVTDRRQQRATASDWLELERKRGISISSTVLQFDYNGYCINLLDTPGHRDFSDDTYRVLTAVDAVIMVIDAGKGIESQTLKLFEVCRHRGIPIFTFINKMDRPTREPLELLDEIEDLLKISVYPINWPLGDGADFRGVWDRLTGNVHLFERTPGGAYKAPVFTGSLSDPLIRECLSQERYEKLVEEVELLELAGATFDPLDVLEARITPVYFGSALNNFGVELLLKGFLDLSIPPTPRKTVTQENIRPTDPEFSAFVFKIQANMDPKHRDRVAFLRIVSGVFQRNMSVFHTRTGKSIRLANANSFFGAERQTIDEAYPGDVVGIVGNSEFAIGDTLSQHPDLFFDEVPDFAAEHFCFLESEGPSQYKRFRKGLEQLLQEGVTQVFYLTDDPARVPMLGAAGPLQFEIVQYRLETEYGASTRLRAAPWSEVRWVAPEADLNLVSSALARRAVDRQGKPVLLFENKWSLDYFKGRHPGVPLSKLPL